MSEHNDIPSVVRKRLRERCERREREMIRGGARGVSAKYTIRGHLPPARARKHAINDAVVGN